MIPVLTLIGLRNVGKSTIFNNLLNDFLYFKNFLKYKNTRYSLFYNNFIFILIDNFGISIKDFNYIEYNLNLIFSKTDIILFVIDINFLHLYENLIILNYLRKFKKYIFLIINKFDNNKLYLNLNNSIKINYIKPYYISALHKYNIKYFINDILYIYCYNKSCIKKKINLKNILILFLGISKSGKSSFINFLLNKNISLFFNFLNIFLKYKKKYYNIIKVISDFNTSLKINFTEIFKIIILSNIILYLIDPIQNLSNCDLKIINFINWNYLNVIFIVSKSDLLSLREKIFFKNYLKKKISINNNYLIFVSYLINYNYNYIKFLINKIYLNSILKISTSKLNKIILKYSKFLKIYYNYNIKINYIHQGGKNPVLIIIHSKKLNIKKCYKKFLRKIFYKKLNVKNIFLKIKI